MAATLNELRKQARALGLKGYSKLRKSDLERLIKDARAGKRAAAAPVPAKERAKPVAKPVTAKAATAPAAQAPRPPSTEEQIESAKFRLTPPGPPSPTEPAGRGLHEPIDQLPERQASALYLLPQKPGVLHAYWRLAPGELARHRHLLLRLSVLRGESLHILEDVPVRSERGHYYFHVPAELDQAHAFLALGYEQGGQFVSVTARGIARIPSLYAASRIDRSWWISDQRFREMYLRAGGFTRGGRLGWSASISSR